MTRTRSVRLLAAFLALLTSTPAFAGPPYVTDDPEPTAYRHWEIYLFAGGLHRAGASEGAAGLDLNYGAAPDLQLTLVLPAGFARENGHSDIARGDVEMAAKFKFLHQKDGTARPDIAFFPRVFLPTSADATRARLLLPLWAAKDWGPWSLFGGGGYTINPGAGNRDFWQGGIGLTHAVTERLSIGAEIYHQGPDAVGARPFTGFNVGAAYNVAGPFSLIASAGPGLQHRDAQGRYTFYTALKMDF